MIIILLVIGLIALLIASYTDLRTREVPDWISYGLIVAGLGVRLLISVISWDYHYILYGLFGFIIAFAIGFFMYYAGQWGGGDSKLIMGLGGILGFNLRGSGILVSFLILTIIVGAIYGLFYSIVLALKDRKKFQKEFMKQTDKVHSTRRIVIIVSGLLLITSFFAAIYLKLMLLGLSMIIFTGFYFFIFARSVESVCMLKRVDPKALTEGDWVVNDIIIDNKKICGPKDLGITKQQIAKLLKLKSENKIKSVLIKEGIPFVPSFLFAFIITIILKFIGTSVFGLIF